MTKFYKTPRWRPKLKINFLSANCYVHKLQLLLLGYNWKCRWVVVVSRSISRDFRKIQHKWNSPVFYAAEVHHLVGPLSRLVPPAVSRSSTAVLVSPIDYPHTHEEHNTTARATTSRSAKLVQVQDARSKTKRTKRLINSVERTGSGAGIGGRAEYKLAIFMCHK